MSTNESTAIEIALAHSGRARVMDRLLTVQNAKTRKGEKLGILTGILYLVLANESGVMNTCTSSTPECRRACLYTAGRGRFNSVRHGRIRKTLWLAADRAGFIAELKRNVVLRLRESFVGNTPTCRDFESELREHETPVAAGLSRSNRIGQLHCEMELRLKLV